MDGITVEGTIDAVAAGAKTISRALPEPVSKGVDFVEALAKASFGLSGIDSSPDGILQQQIELQQEMLRLSLVSNLERTRHETKMAPTRNIRLS